MKKRIGIVTLLNKDTAQFEEAHLFRGIDADNLADIEGRWQPLFKLKGQEAIRNGLSLSDINAEDAHWEWGKKSVFALNQPLLHDIYVLECGGRTQGIMLTTKGGTSCFSRHPDHRRADMLYVELLASAPWNRPRLVSKPIYKGVGRVLLATAVSSSIEQEFDGRIGLHSLPGAEDYYKDVLQMTDFGADANHDDLRYFEFSSNQATSFLTKTPN